MAFHWKSTEQQSKNTNMYASIFLFCLILILFSRYALFMSPELQYHSIVINSLFYIKYEHVKHFEGLKLQVRREKKSFSF
jgi:hypothetical protein